MHELSVITALLDKVKSVAKSEGFNTVKTIGIEIGQMTCVDPQRLQFCFDMVKEDSSMADAVLMISRVPATVRCKQCGDEHAVAGYGEACCCGSYECEFLTGKELNLTEIECE
ncbi:hydrogenase maturation nickel metallochaperone HypA [Alteromonas facilis]|uniref:hydrogenase maturation nickel metallochaperone HypA/HybF n=1 Tax=Alteromonas facilis TaxID=2048004 RepID=UPI000C292401|nr:hydrogenase maturation nickel metallochaperone HypA [Alteromonas facilis]